jgi:hypothetical protein
VTNSFKKSIKYTFSNRLLVIPLRSAKGVAEYSRRIITVCSIVVILARRYPTGITSVFTLPKVENQLLKNSVKSAFLRGQTQGWLPRYSNPENRGLIFDIRGK